MQSRIELLLRQQRLSKKDVKDILVVCFFGSLGCKMNVDN